MSMMSTALAWLSSNRKTYLAETGSIEREGATTASVSMTIGHTEADIEGADGVTVRSNIADFLITAADYKISDVVVEPQRGDKIIYGGKEYRVVPIVGGAAWRYAENVNRTTLRVHTKELQDAS